ncbi:hypothetical protein, partial [Methylobacterium ajmalii]|uniref:hypothetical protein n=1 Tax=Methylobacterium ajmalii TaxID=2738439 RepID=UPI0039A60791
GVERGREPAAAAGRGLRGARSGGRGLARTAPDPAPLGHLREPAADPRPRRQRAAAHLRRLHDAVLRHPRPGQGLGAGPARLELAQPRHRPRRDGERAGAARRPAGRARPGIGLFRG